MRGSFSAVSSGCFVSFLRECFGSTGAIEGLGGGFSGATSVDGAEVSAFGALGVLSPGSVSRGSSPLELEVRTFPDPFKLSIIHKIEFEIFLG